MAKMSMNVTDTIDFSDLKNISNEFGSRIRALFERSSRKRAVFKKIIPVLHFVHRLFDSTKIFVKNDEICFYTESSLGSLCPRTKNRKLSRGPAMVCQPRATRNDLHMWPAGHLSDTPVLEAMLPRQTAQPNKMELVASLASLSAV